MSGFSIAAAFGAAVDQAERSSKNLALVREAKLKREREQELFDLKKKQAETSLEIAKAKGDHTDVQNKMLQAQMDEYFKQQDTINKGKDAQIAQVEHEESQNAQQAAGAAKQIYQSSPDVQSMVASRLNPQLTQTPGPQGSMIQGYQDNSDGPEAVPSSFENVPAHILQPSMSPSGRPGFTQAKNSDDFIGKRIDALKAQGAQLLPEEQRFDYERNLKARGMKYNRVSVLNKARQMALDDVRSIDPHAKAPNPASIRGYIPKAENELYGEAMGQPAKPEMSSDEAAAAMHRNSENLKKQYKIHIPKTIKKTTEALKYLIDHGMTREEGIAYLRKNAATRR